MVGYIQNAPQSPICTIVALFCWFIYSFSWARAFLILCVCAYACACCVYMCCIYIYVWSVEHKKRVREREWLEWEAFNAEVYKLEAVKFIIAAIKLEASTRYCNNHTVGNKAIHTHTNTNTNIMYCSLICHSFHVHIFISFAVGWLNIEMRGSAVVRKTLSHCSTFNVHCSLFGKVFGTVNCSMFGSQMLQ